MPDGARGPGRRVAGDFLWSDETGLPSDDSEAEVAARAEDVFRHVFRAYPKLPSPYYEDAA